MKDHKREVDRRYLGIRSVMETPILNDRHWAKIPDIPADAFFLDMEDSVPPALKEQARDRVVEFVKDPSYFKGRLTLARPNNLATPWGKDDLAALAEAGVTLMTYPKLQTPEELLEIQSILRAGGADPDFFVLIETSRAVLEVVRLAAMDEVFNLMVGTGDLTLDSGITLLVGDDQQMNPALDGVLVQTVLAASAFGCVSTCMPFLPDIRDLEETRRRFLHYRQLGFTTGATFYPPHVELINELFSPRDVDIAQAEEVIGLYETALANGDPAVIHNGRALLVHDYEKARLVKARADALASCTC